MTYEPNTNIQTLTTQLEELLTAPDQNLDTLTRQTQILDQLFTKLMTENIAQRVDNPRHYNRDDTMQWLEITLKIQKQCNDTVKTRGALEYMNTLNRNIHKAPLSPHPVKIEKQTEGS